MDNQIINWKDKFPVEKNLLQARCRGLHEVYSLNYIFFLWHPLANKYKEFIKISFLIQ
jgi:hypothetical protein